VVPPASSGRRAGLAGRQSGRCAVRVGPSTPSADVRSPRIPLLLSCLTLLAPAAAGLPAPSLAQVQTFINKPGSNIGPATKIEPTNCVTAPDGSVTCDTKIENPPGNTPAKPQYSPFGQ
jgi:hypothetical protein